jgi:hypothetical protein
MRNLRKRHIWLPVICGALTPSVTVFILEVFVGHVSPVRSGARILERQFGEGENLFLIMAFGFIPFAVLIGLTALLSLKTKGRRLDCLFFGGLAGILVLMVPGHAAVWYPLYGGGHMASTAVIAFLFIPFYCIATMGIGSLTGWAISFLPFFRNETGKGHGEQVHAADRLQRRPR